MKQIPLTQGKFALVDDQDYEFLMQWKWCAHRNKKRIYAHRTDYTNKKYTIRMHNIVAARMGLSLNDQIDHIDRDGLNNQRNNLREATASQQKINQETYKNNTSGQRGICWNIQHKKWQVRIGVNGKRVHLGYFDNIKDATLAYNIAAEKFFGEFRVMT